MKSVDRKIQARQIQHFFKADPEYGRTVAEALGYKLQDFVAAQFSSLEGLALLSERQPQTASYLYKYPQAVFPYAALVEKTQQLSRTDPEYELLDTGIFDEDRYFDVFEWPRYVG